MNPKSMNPMLGALALLVAGLESKDISLKLHSARVARYAGEIATAMELPPDQVLVTRRAGLLHDLGKLAILDSILQKPNRLTGEERAMVRRHPLIAEKALRPLPFLAREAAAVRHHHEHYDGRGYPDGLRGEAIPLPARVIAVADAFDAMISNRPYRRALPIEVALEEVRGGAGTQFDPAVADAFASIPLHWLGEISRCPDTGLDAPSAARELWTAGRA